MRNSVQIEGLFLTSLQVKAAMAVPLFIEKNSNHLDHLLEETEAAAVMFIYFRPPN